jgi:gamma-glutamylaminecyclotransferase
VRVAVYGTLRQGFGNHRLLENSKFLGKTKTDAIFSMHGHVVPWISNGGSTQITVEVYEIDEQTLQSLDWLEGYPSYYDRQIINTEFGEAWIYFIDNRLVGNYIESGDWAEYRKGELNDWS